LTPQDITGFVFPLTGSDANEVAIRTARKFTGKHKILSRYKSYHGSSVAAINATGDFRRGFAENGVSGFVKFFDLQAFQFRWGNTQQDSISNYLAYLEETIINENPATVAAIMMETVTGSAGVLVNPPEVVQGVRALCDKYGILLIIDEVMAGIGRCGEMFAFQSYEGLTPDIFTCAKGLSGSYLPLSAVGFRKDI
jgi:taurine--2-oxoglutarate transaminase